MAKGSEAAVYDAAVNALYELGYRVVGNLNTATTPWTVEVIDMDSPNTTKITFSIDWEK